MRARTAGFTLMELVVAIAVAGVVLAFTTSFIMAPLNAYDSQSRRAAVIDEAAASWPMIEADLRRALPNSLRARRNGSYVVLEMLRVEDFARYKSDPDLGSFTIAGVLRGVTVRFDSTDHYLSVNNLGTPGADAYALTGSMTPASTQIVIDNSGTGEQTITATPATAFNADSPRRMVYLVSGPVTYLCDESRGTLTRYANYPVAANQTSWDTPGDFSGAGIAGMLVATGLTACRFVASPSSATVPQTASLTLTATRASGESVTLFHAAGSGWLP
jgi:MSHA biogenesis protein MshO